MIAIITATGQNAAFHGLDEGLPIPLLSLVDRPFLQHVVEVLVRQGVRRFEFILSHLPEKIEACLGDGTRWGASFHYHLVPSAQDAFRQARTVAAGTTEDVLLVSGTSLPQVELSIGIAGTAFCYAGVWTGWALPGPGAGALCQAVLSQMASDMSAEGLPEGLRPLAVESCLSLAGGEELLRAQREVLEGTFPGLMIAGRQAEPGVWISRNVVLHPFATVEAPVYIGENCRINKGARLGPSAAIGANCIVDSHSSIVNSMVAPGTYVGEALELDSVIVDRNRLVNVRVGASFLVSETFLLGNLTLRTPGRTAQRLRDRLIACGLLFFLWPLLLLTLLFLAIVKKERMVTSAVVSIPADTDPTNWQVTSVLHISDGSGQSRRNSGRFFREFLPGLISVLLGNIFLVGVRPRTRAELEAMPPDWKSLYLKTKSGLITETDVMFGIRATEDEQYTGEAFYSATESARHDLKLAALWMWKMTAGSGSATASLGDDL